MTGRQIGAPASAECGMRSAELCSRRPVPGAPLSDIVRFVDGAQAVFAQQFHKLGQTPFFVCAQVIMDMPAEIIFPELEVIFWPAGDDMVEALQSERLGITQGAAKGGGIDPAP